MLVKPRRARDEDLAVYFWSLITVLTIGSTRLEKCKTKYKDKIKKTHRAHNRVRSEEKVSASTFRRQELRGQK